VIEEINRHTQGRAIISTGVGQHQMWAAQYFDFAEPRKWRPRVRWYDGLRLRRRSARSSRRDMMVIDIDGDASIA
jgi:acetolactate synthase-1/2/3 large subunit